MGKVPKRSGDALIRGRQLSKLEAELNDAVMKQEFERAAELRDQIRELKASGKEEV